MEPFRSFWQECGLAEDFDAECRTVGILTGAMHFGPPHVVLALFRSDTSWLSAAIEAQLPHFNKQNLNEVLLQAIRTSKPVHSHNVEADPQLQAIIQTLCSDAEWNRAAPARRQQLLTRAVLGALSPPLFRLLTQSGVPVAELLGRLADISDSPIPGGERRARDFAPPAVGLAASKAQTPQAETASVREGGRLRGAPASPSLPSTEAKAAAPLQPVRGRQLPVDDIQCTAFAPPALARGETVLLQVFAHLQTQAEAAAHLATQFDETSLQRGFSRLSESIRQGQVLAFELKVTGGTADIEIAKLRWRGEPESVQFLITAGTAENLSAVLPRITISLDSIPIGQIAFKMSVSSQSAAMRSEPMARAESFQRFFISYASKDRPEVIKRVQMLPRIGKQFRQDLLDLDPGERFERRLFEFMDECDATLLFWSSNAKASEWVLRECRYCIDKKGLDRLLPVIIERPPPLPPPELSDLHMNDKLLYFIE